MSGATLFKAVTVQGSHLKALFFAMPEIYPSIKRQRLAFILVLVVAAGLRLWRISITPPGFHFDESFEGLEAWRILTELTYKPVFLAGNFGVPPLNAYANAIMFGLFRLFGGEVGPTAMRVTAAIIGMSGVAAVYGLAREQQRLDDRLSSTYPWLAAASLALMRWHVHFSRMGIEPILVPTLWAAATWLLLRAWRTNRRINFLALGVVLAGSLYAYQAAWIIPLLIPLTTLHLSLQDRQRLVFRWPGLALAGLIAMLLALPLAWFFLHHPDLFLLRPTQVAVVGDTRAGQGPWANLIATFKMFVPMQGTGDLDPRRNLPGAPALSIWQAVPFFVGLGIALWRWRRPGYSLLLAGLAGLLLPGVFSNYAPHFHRILGASGPAALLAGLGIAEPVRWMEARFGGRTRQGMVGLAVGLLVLTGATTVRDYFFRWALLPDLYYAFDVGLWDIGQWVAAQPVDRPIYLTPRDASHPTLAFAWETRGRPAPVTFDGRHIFPLTAGRNATAERYIVVAHEDFRTPLLLPDVFPDASIAPQWRNTRNELYAQAYIRPPGALPQRHPQYPRNDPIGDGIRLVGYDRIPDSPRAGEILYLQLYWQVEAPPRQDWTVFTHVEAVQPSGERTVKAGFDSRPGRGSLPTHRWQPGWLVLDEYQIPLPADLPPGDYELAVGLYLPDGTRIPPTETGQILGPITVHPPP